MHKTLKDFTPEEIAERISEALEVAFSFFLPHTDRRGEGYKLAEQVAQDLNYNLNMFHVTYGAGDGVEYYHKKSIAFYCDYEVRPALGWAEDRGVVAVCQISWGSGGAMDPTKAVATASLHLEAATKACQAQVAMQDALRGLRGSKESDKESWELGMEHWWRTAHQSKEKYWTELNQRKPAKS